MKNFIEKPQATIELIMPKLIKILNKTIWQD
jgi:hypothetical protein